MLNSLSAAEWVAKDNIATVSDHLAPCVDNPVDFSSFAPILRIIVSLLDAQSSQAGASLLHALALIVDNWETAHLSCASCAFPEHPATHADSRVDPLGVRVMEQDSDRLSSTVEALEVLNLDSVRGDSLTRASVTHIDCKILFNLNKISHL